MLGNQMDFSSCAIWIDFHKSSHIYSQHVSAVNIALLHRCVMSVLPYYITKLYIVSVKHYKIFIYQFSLLLSCAIHKHIWHWLQSTTENRYVYYRYLVTSFSSSCCWSFSLTSSGIVYKYS